MVEWNSDGFHIQGEYRSVPFARAHPILLLYVKSVTIPLNHAQYRSVPFARAHPILLLYVRMVEWNSDGFHIQQNPLIVW